MLSTNVVDPETFVVLDLVKGKAKGFPLSLPSVWPGADPGVQAVSRQVTLSHSPGRRLPLPFARPAVIFPAAEHHRALASIKLYCLVTEAHRCEQLAQGCYAAFARSRIWMHELDLEFNTLPVVSPRHHCTGTVVNTVGCCLSATKACYFQCGMVEVCSPLGAVCLLFVFILCPFCSHDLSILWPYKMSSSETWWYSIS